MNKITCISVDIINPDKPAASLAFLSGCCELVEQDYDAISVNTEMLVQLTAQQYNDVYNNIKLDRIEQDHQLITPIIDGIIQRVKDFGSNIVLMSLFSFMQVSVAKLLMKKLREHCAVTILAGGPGIHSTDSKGCTNGKMFFDLGLIDFYILGEGDDVLPRFLQGERLMLGLNGHDQGPESWVPQLSDLDRYYVMPSYKKIRLDVYHNLEAKSKPIMSISTSRGCVRACSFCDVARSWPKFRFRSGDHVSREVLKIHQDTGAVNFTIVDSLINGSLKSFREFNLAMIRLKQQHSSLADFSYNGMFIVRDAKSHPEEFFRMIAEAGCEQLAIGVETGSDRLRFDMNKKFTNRDLDHHLEMCHRYGIRNTFLMFVGYPTETREDFEQTLQMLERYQHYLIDGTIIGINFAGVFTMLTGTPVYDNHEQMGIELISGAKVGELAWINHSNPQLDMRERVLRDLEFREHAARLRYPIPYSQRYLQYLKEIDQGFLPISD